MESPQLLKVPHMKKIFALFVITILLLTYGCNYYGGIKGTVVNNTTGKPIEGAVVVAQWTKTRGIPGLQYHNLHKISETLTDKEGKFSLSGTIGILLESPEMIIFKEGYIPWRNDMVYPGGRDIYVKKNEWNNHQTYLLDMFTGTGKEIINLSTFTLHSFMDDGVLQTPVFRELTRKLSMAEYDEIQKLKNPPK